MIDVSILIVNYNTGKLLKECVDSVFRYEKEIIFEIIIAENASDDNSNEIVKDLMICYDNVRGIFLNKKKSFSEANNLAHKQSSGEFVLIMNPDIIFKEKLLNKLISNLRSDNKLGTVCPLLTGKDGMLQRRYFQRYPTILQFILFYSVTAKFFFKFPYLINKYLQNNEINPKSDKLEYTEQIPCAFFLTSRKDFENAGRMDERYDLFFEDVDLSYQIHKDKRLAIDTSVSIVHYGGASFVTSDDYWLHGRFILSMIIFFDKNYGRVRTFMLKILAVINSYIILFFENIKKVFGKGSEYRIRKHSFFIKEFKKKYR